MPYAKMVNPSKDGISLQIRWWSQITLSFDVFLPEVKRFGMIYTLIYWCFRISCDKNKFNEKLETSISEDSVSFVIYWELI